jgi:uncharacterized repeat protein (TIGR03803 family)
MLTVQRSIIVRAALVISLPALVAGSGRAQTAFKTIYSFQGGSDGQAPNGVIFGKDGALYGTTYRGGSSQCTNDNTWTQPCGTVFELTGSGTSWTNHVLYEFEGASGGAFPDGPLVVDSGGTLYGTTLMEGRIEYGNGTVFSLTPPANPGGTWTEMLLYIFGKHEVPAGNSPFIPIGGVLPGPNGTLFGVTHYNYYNAIAPPASGGAIFQLAPPTAPGGGWTERTLFGFLSSSSPGIDPVGSLITDGTVLYGTASAGGTAGCGAAYEAIPAAGPYTVESLHEFAGVPDGCGPYAALTLGPGGVLYGTTANGGISAAPCPSNGCGVVFQLTPPASPGAAWTEQAIHRFIGFNGDGAFPYSVLVLGADGALYGTTEGGGLVSGSNPACSVNGVAGCGTVFKMAPSGPGGAWVETVLHSFTDENGEGADPAPYLTPGTSGSFYGTTFSGGAAGYGTAFEIKP